MSDYEPYTPESYTPEAVTQELDTYTAGVDPAGERTRAAAVAALDSGAKAQGRSFWDVAGADDYAIDAKIRDMNPKAPEGTVVPDPSMNEAQRIASEIAEQANAGDGARGNILSVFNRRG